MEIQSRRHQGKYDLHLLSVEEQVTVCTHTLRPLRFREQSSMDIDAHCEMVVDQIFAGGTQVHRIPVLELFEKRFGLILRDRR